jgi:multiple sugar transport system ATP-binding protein
VGEVAIQRVWKRYREVEAVKDLTLDIDDGTYFCILGPSGCGKTSTLRMIAGLEEITAGDILIAGERVNDLEARERDVAMAFETYALYPHLSAYENIAFPLRVRGVGAGDLGARVRQVAEMLHLTEILGQRPGTLSGGQQQRLALARALVRAAAVYLLDEPLSHLDAQERVLLRVEMKRIQRLNHLTFVLVTHDQLEAMTMADRIAIMNLGVLQQVGTPEEVFERPANLFVANFVGEPTINTLPGHLATRNDLLAVRVDGQLIAVPDRYRRSLQQGRSDEVVVAIRPPYVAPCDPGAADALRGEVYVFESIGDIGILTVRIGAHLVRAELAPGMRYDIGEPVGVRFDPAHLLVFDAASAIRIVPDAEGGDGR